MATKKVSIKDGAECEVIAGTHKGKSGTVRDINTSKTGAVTITVVQKRGTRFKTLAKNVAVNGKSKPKKSAASNATVKADSIEGYHALLSSGDQLICKILKKEIDANLPKAESKVWHAHPVWFLDGNPIVGYSKQKAGIRLMFWSGMGFEEDKLQPGTGKFKDASVVYTSAEEINTKDLRRWLKKSEKIQWDYKNLVKRKGKLERLK